MIREFKSLPDLMVAFRDPQAAINHFTAVRWRHGKFCPYCGHNKIWSLKAGNLHRCAGCRTNFSITVGTIFENTKLPLKVWFGAMWLIANHKKGIASTQLAVDLNVTQKTAWFVLHRLRYAARTRSFNRPLKGTVEVDETYIGGNDSNKPKNKRGKKKQIIVGMLERGGELRMVPVKSIVEFRSQVLDNVEKGSRLMSDEASVLTGLERHYDRTVVNHTRGQYGDGADGHTNSIEGAWALLKRQIYGIHHWVSPKHLERYVGEMAWRFNRRGMTAQDRVNEMFSFVEGRLTYRELIA